jgi:phospholipid-binding lipoprotein MlaA
MKFTGRWSMLVLIAALSGCASVSSPDPRDPFEGFNRTMFQFNDRLDQVALKPAATVYSDVLPSFVQTGIGNFFGNIGDVWSAVNSLLQGNLERGFNGVMRVAVNTVLGFGGVLDISSEAGLQSHREDFGQTLGRWGVESGPYVVLPFFGSSTVRDTAGLPVDIYGNLWHYKEPVVWRNTGTALHVLDTRASLLDASNLLEDAALDKYQFVRDAFLQRRAGQVEDHGRARPDSDWESESAAPEPPLPATIQPISGSN